MNTITFVSVHLNFTLAVSLGTQDNYNLFTNPCIARRYFRRNSLVTEIHQWV